MTGEESMTGIQSIEDALSLLHRGNHFVVCSPTSELALQLVTRIVARLQKGKATLLSFAPVDFELNKKKLHGTVELSQKESPSQIIGLIKERIEEIPDGGILLVCIPENHPSLFSSPEKQQQVVSAVLASSRRRSIASIWFVRQHALLANVLLTLKNESDYFLQISRIGTLNLAQFIHARGEGDAQFFLPRILTLSASGTALSSFSAMSLNAKPGEADENPIDAQYRAIFESAPEAMILFELWGGYRAFNKRGIEVLGYEEKDLATMTLKDLVPAEKLFHTVRSLILLKRKGKLTFSTQALKRSGRPVEVEVRASLLGKNTFLAVCADISERVRSEAALTDLSREYSSFVEALPYPYAVFINRRLSAKNGAFDLLFPFLGNDAPSVTDFFGRRNADLLKEIGTMLEDNHPTSAITNREVHIPERGHRPGRETVATEVSISVIRYRGKRAL